MLDEIIDSFLSRSLVDVLDGTTETVTRPVGDLLRTNAIGVEITPFTTREFDEPRSGVAQALELRFGLIGLLGRGEAAAEDLPGEH